MMVLFIFIKSLKKWGFLLLVLPGCFLLFVSCNSDQTDQYPSKTSADNDLPDHIRELENLKVFPIHEDPADTVEQIRETVFETNEDVVLYGYISQMVIDDQDRVYIVSTVPGNLGIYIFNPDGSYLRTIGRFGRGPGEFEAISSMDIWDNRLYVLGPRLQKYAVYSLETFEMTDEAMITRNLMPETDQFAHVMKVSDLFVTKGGKMLISMTNLSLLEDQDINRRVFYLMQADGEILPGRILELERFQAYFPNVSRDGITPVYPTFMRDSFFSVSDDGHFFTIWSEDFLIKEYDPEGNQIQAFYYPVTKSPLAVKDLDLSDRSRRILSRYDLPDTWPAVHTMEMDDEGRMWIATITDSEETFTWWVLSQKGELIARFNMPGERLNRDGMVPPLIEIKNSFFYTRERDIPEGIDRIVKYRIEMGS